VSLNPGEAEAENTRRDELGSRQSSIPRCRGRSAWRWVSPRRRWVGCGEQTR